MTYDDERDWLSYDEAALLAQVDRLTVYRWWCAGLLGEVRFTPSGRPRFHRDSVKCKARTETETGVKS